jgi:acetyl esterase
VKFPVPVEQGEAVLAWLRRDAVSLGADPLRVMVMGDSAGGNLSAVLARKHPQALKAQVLVYPATDGDFRAFSADENSAAPILSKRLMQFFYDCYARTEEDKRHPDFSPLLARDLTGLPPCLIITAEYDVLRDDGFAYAQRLQAAGVTVQHEHYADIHGFLSFPTLCASGDEAFAAIGRFVGKVL